MFIQWLFVLFFIKVAFPLALYICRKMKMSEAIDDPVAFTRLTDTVLQQIQLSDDPNLQQVTIYSTAPLITCIIIAIQPIYYN